MEKTISLIFSSLGFKSKLCVFLLFLCTLRLYAFKRKRPTLYYLNKKIKTFHLKVVSKTQKFS